MSKQILIDLLIVLGVPLAILFGYLYFSSGTGNQLLSSISTTASLPGEANPELGAKTKIALTKLNSINFDRTLFNDPTFLTLEDFTQPIPTSEIGREYPFSLTPELRVMLRNSTANNKTTTPPNTIRIPIGADVSQKLDVLKSGTK